MKTVSCSLRRAAKLPRPLLGLVLTTSLAACVTIQQKPQGTPELIEGVKETTLLATLMHDMKIVHHEYDQYMDEKGVMKFTDWQKGTATFTADWAARFKITDPINGRISPDGTWIVLMARQQLPGQDALHFDIFKTRADDPAANPVNITGYLQDPRNRKDEGLEKEDPFWVTDDLIVTKLNYRIGRGDNDNTNNYLDTYQKGRSEIAFYTADGTVKAQFKAADDAELSKPIICYVGSQAYLVASTGSRQGSDIAYAPIDLEKIKSAAGRRELSNAPQVLTFTLVPNFNTVGIEDYYPEPDPSNPARFYVSRWNSAADKRDMIGLYDMGRKEFLWPLPFNDAYNNNSDSAAIDGFYMLVSQTGKGNARYDVNLVRIDGKAVTYPGLPPAGHINLNDIYKNFNGASDDEGSNVWLPPALRRFSAAHLNDGHVSSTQTGSNLAKTAGAFVLK